MSRHVTIRVKRVYGDTDGMVSVNLNDREQIVSATGMVTMDHTMVDLVTVEEREPRLERPTGEG